MSENRLMLSRVLANYAGLLLNLIIGLVLTRELIRVLGGEGFGLISLFGTTVGVGIMIQDIVRQTMIRELGYAYHHPDGDFKQVQANAFGVVGIVACFAALLFAGFWLAAPTFQIPSNLVNAGRWFIVAQAIQSIVFILAAPLYNLFIVTERMVFANALVVAERVLLLASIITVSFLELPSISEKIIFYGFASGIAVSATYLAGTIIILLIDPIARPCIGGISKAGIKNLFKHSMMQGTAITAINLHVRVDAFIVNSFVGLIGNLTYGLGLQFSSYIRRVAMGMTQGLDAVATRFSAGNTERDVRWLLRRSTQMHAAVIFPVAAFAMYFTSELIHLWVGDLIVGQDTHVEHLIIAMVYVMAIGVSARALSDAWIQILYGAGKVKKYLLPLIISAACNPVIAIVLSIYLPEKWAGLGPPIAMSLVFLIFHCGWIGMIAQQELQANYHDVIVPLIAPAVGTALACLSIQIPPSLINISTELQMPVAAAIFGLTYATYCYFLLLNKAQRLLIWSRVRSFGRR